MIVQWFISFSFRLTVSYLLTCVVWRTSWVKDGKTMLRDKGWRLMVIVLGRNWTHRNCLMIGQERLVIPWWMLTSSPLPLQLDILHSVFNIFLTSFSSHNAQLSSLWYYSHLALSRHFSTMETVQVPEVNILERVKYTSFILIVGSTA